MRLAIVGAGLIGRSVTLAARRANPEVEVVEIDRGDALEPARGADVIVLATPVDVILALLGRHADLLRASVVIDTGSTKRTIVAAAHAAGLSGFVGGHPMAGGSATGPGAARPDLFDGRPWFLVPAAAHADAVKTAQAFVSSLGARAVMLEDHGESHDRAMAALSHVPQVVASTLMVLVDNAAGERLEWAGTGLRDTTRLAQSSAGMWRSMLQTNADEVTPLLRTLAQSIAEVADQLEAGRDIDELFAQANRARATLEACDPRPPSRSPRS